MYTGGMQRNITGSRDFQWDGGRQLTACARLYGPRSMHVKPTKRVFRDVVQCSGAHPQATSCGGVEADRWVGEGLTLETLHGLPEARPLSPVTPVDVKLWSDPVTAYELLNAL